MTPADHRKANPLQVYRHPIGPGFGEDHASIAVMTSTRRGGIPTWKTVPAAAKSASVQAIQRGSERIVILFHPVKVRGGCWVVNARPGASGRCAARGLPAAPSGRPGHASGPRARGPGLWVKGTGRGRGGGPASSQRRAPRPVGRVSVSSPLREDPDDHGGIGDHGDDPHQPPAPGAPERVHLEDPAEQLGPAQSGRFTRLAPPRAPGPAGVPTVIALTVMLSEPKGRSRIEIGPFGRFASSS